MNYTNLIDGCGTRERPHASMPFWGTTENQIRKMEKHNGSTALDAVITRQEAARLFKVKPNTIDYHARLGRLQRVKIPGSSRAVGFTRASVEACFGKGA